MLGVVTKTQLLKWREHGGFLAGENVRVLSSESCQQSPLLWL